MPRREFTKRTQRQALARAEGRCEGRGADGTRCPCQLQPARYHFDHIIAVALSDDASLANCQVLCKPCHAAKTRTDVGTIAKVLRIRDRHTGVTPPRRASLPGGRTSPFKRLIGGRVVRRCEALEPYPDG